jgi:hypothetical protein
MRAEGGSRTRKATMGTRLSTWRVYQFHHFRMVGRRRDQSLPGAPTPEAGVASEVLFLMS